MVLVVGASGATGRLVVAELLERGESVRVIVRSPENLPEALKNHENLSVVSASILDLSDDQMAEQVRGCDAVISCLGHNLTFKGIFGQPRRLVTEATRRLCEAVEASAPEASVKFILMNTVGNSNRDIQESVSFADKLVIGLIRFLVPPQADNEAAADYLRTKIDRKDGVIEWVAVRPDSLLNDDSVSDYDVFASPIRSAIFNSGKTSRINVAHFMSDLASNDDIWQKWLWQMPVVYNRFA